MEHLGPYPAENGKKLTKLQGVDVGLSPRMKSKVSKHGGFLVLCISVAVSFCSHYLDLLKFLAVDALSAILKFFRMMKLNQLKRWFILNWV